jgi:hypothetical protein
MTAVEQYRVITVDEVERVLGHTDDIEYPFRDFTEDQEFRLYPGGLLVADDFGPGVDDEDWVPFNVIVDGDLTVGGTLDWWDWRYGNLLVVTGTLRARNVLLSGCPNLVVRGDMLVSGGIQGHHGEDGGLLRVSGRTEAALVVNTLYFRMLFAAPPDAVVLGDPDRTGCPVDFTDRELPDVLRPELLDDQGRVAEYEVGEALLAGQPILRPNVRPRRELPPDERPEPAERSVPAQPGVAAGPPGERLLALCHKVDASERHGEVDELIASAEEALSLVPAPDRIWHFTPEGAAYEEITRRVGGIVARELLRRGESGRALPIVDRALAVAAPAEYDRIRDTKVRILLALNRTHEAYLIVDKVLTRAPESGVFADIKAAPDFQT